MLTWLQAEAFSKLYDSAPYRSNKEVKSQDSFAACKKSKFGYFHYNSVLLVLFSNFRFSMRFRFANCLGIKVNGVEFWKFKTKLIPNYTSGY